MFLGPKLLHRRFPSSFECSPALPSFRWHSGGGGGFAQGDAMRGYARPTVFLWWLGFYTKTGISHHGKQERQPVFVVGTSFYAW